MTTRVNTVEYAFASSGSATTTASSTAYAFPQITVHIPETDGRTFRSAILQCTAIDSNTSACQPNSRSLSISLNGASVSGCSLSDTHTNSGEHQSFVYTRDVTAYFNTNFGTGASATATACLLMGNLVTANQTAKLILTYEYDDASASARVKTVKIPIESAASSLTNALAEITAAGANQVPNLSTFLPESSPSLRDLFFEVMSNDSNVSGTTNFQLELQLDSETVTNTGSSIQNLNSSRFFYWIWKRDDLITAGSTSASHAFKARSNNTTGRYAGLGAVLNVTYAYDHANTASVLNSVWVPFFDGAEAIGQNSEASQSRYSRVIWIQEPSPIALKQSGLILNLNDNATMTVSVRVSGSAGGGQTARSYVINAGGLTCGGNTLIHRIDSSASAGSSLGLDRGKNTLVLDAFIGTGSIPGVGTSGLLLLNYQSGISASGVGVHNHTTVWTIADMYNASAITRYFGAIAPVIPETRYFLNAMGYQLQAMANANIALPVALNARILTGERTGDGWEVVGVEGYRGDGENAMYFAWLMGSEYWKHHPNDPQSDRLDVETARAYRLDAWGHRPAIQAYLTHHAITYAISGSISSGASDVVVNAYTVAGEKVASTLTGTGGSYSLTWYDNTVGVWTEAYQNASLIGRSASGLAQ